MSNRRRAAVAAEAAMAANVDQQGQEQQDNQQLVPQPPPPMPVPQPPPQQQPAAVPVAAAREVDMCSYHKLALQCPEKAAVTKVWYPARGRRDVLTQRTAGVGCTTMSVTLQRMKMSVLLRETALVLQAAADAIVDENGNKKDYVAGYVADFPHSSAPYTAQANQLGKSVPEVEAARVNGKHDAWKKLREEFENEVVAGHYNVVQSMLETVRDSSASLGFISRRASQLASFEKMFTACLYPSTMEHLQQLLRVGGISELAAGQSGGLVVSGFGGTDNETCCLCTERDLDKTYVRIMPRCFYHGPCIDFRRDQQMCKCNNKYFHLECLSHDMLAQYRGDRNNGVGRTAQCPLCRGFYCYADLVTVRIERGKTLPANSAATRYVTVKGPKRPRTEDLPEDDSDSLSVEEVNEV